MAVNLLATLGARFGAEALARAHRDAAARGYRLVRVDEPDDRLCAWIDWRFAPSWWSSEARTSSVWYAERDGTIAGFAAFGSPDRTYPWLRAYRGRDDVAVFGPYGVAEEDRGTGIGAALFDAAMCGLAARAPLALIPAVGGERLIAMYRARCDAVVANEFTYDVPAARAVILASGSGTNAQAVIDGIAAGSIALEIAGVVANVDSAPVRLRARAAGIAETAVLWDRAHEPRSAFDARVSDAVARYEPDLVLLLGWMHMLPPAFIERFPEALNVHPAFLPFDGTAPSVVMPDGTQIAAFRGARSPEATIAAGARWSGASVHRLAVAADSGAIAVRVPFPLAAGAQLPDLRALLAPAEHAAVAKAIRRWGFERPS